MTFYQQLPLFADQPIIRLIQLHIVVDADQIPRIQGIIDTYDLRDQPNYDALSYAWGSEDVPEHITLDGEVFAQKAGTAKKMWIDAICINQMDQAEKSHQVMLMKDIYANADGVTAWIGVPDPLSDLAFDTLKRFTAEDGTLNGSATCRQIQHEVDSRRQSIDRLLERRYFTRMWIIQEIVVGRKITVLCGALRIGFDEMLIAVNRMTGSSFYRFSPSVASLSYIGSWRSSFHGADFPNKEQYLDLRLFIDSRDRSATDPRDKLYALRGIANKALGTRIKVKYYDSVEKVYIEFSRIILEHRSDLQILSAVMLRHRQMSSLDLPSYVPDWSLPSFGGGILQRYYRFKPAHLFRASGASVPKISFVEGTNMIRIEGSYLDSIAQVIPIKTLLGTGVNGSVTISEDILKDLTATTLASARYASTNEKYWSRYFAGFGDWGLDHSHGDLSDLPLAAWELVSEGVDTIIEDKNMFVTGQGYLGLGHEGFCEGDLVCILSGGEVPFLLRETKISGGDGRRCRFLCECYVHGIMDGEAVADSYERVLEEFLID